MIEKIKQMPVSVILAYAFLVTILILMLWVQPWLFIGFTLIGAAIWSVFRIINYSVSGE